MPVGILSQMTRLPLRSPPSPVSNFLTLEQIRDIVAPTRGFYSRDYSLYLGWNNVSRLLALYWLQMTS